MRFPDCSSYQDSVNMKAVKSRGGARVIGLKATEGMTINDSRYAARVKDARAAGLAPMVYHFSHPENNSPKAEVGHLLNVTGGPKPGDMPHALDYESLAGGNQNWFDDWLAEYKRRCKHLPIVYGGRKLREQGIKGRGTRLWLSAYTNTRQPWKPAGWTSGNVVAWQYTETGSFPGVSGRGDVNQWLASDLLFQKLRLGLREPLDYLTKGERKLVVRLAELRTSARKRGKWLESEKAEGAELKKSMRNSIRDIEQQRDPNAENRRERANLLRDAIAGRKLGV